MKNLLFISLFFSLGFSSLAQEKKYYSVSKNNSNIDDYIVLKKDTLFANNKKSFLIDFENKQDYLYYKSIVFPYSKKGPLMQWKSEIKIYMNENIDKYIRKNFKNFIKSFPAIKNLKISLVKDIEDANYYITTTSQLKSIYTDQKLTDKELKNKLYYNFYYTIERKGSSFKSCIFEFDPNKIFDRKVFLRKMKKVFFNTLGQFMTRTFYRDETSLLSRRDSITDYITSFDKKILNYHYQNICNYKVYRKDFIINHKSYEK